MKNVKTPTSRSYQEFLIEFLKDPQEAADYIEGVLEEGEDEPQLLQTVLKNVIEAYEKNNQLSDSARKQYEQLDNILRDSRGREIYNFLGLLNDLGFRVEIEIKEQNLANEEKIQRVIDYYGQQSEDEALAEDEAAFDDQQTIMQIPSPLVPLVRELLAKHQKL
jgi:DNA-binding phage protein